MGASDWIQDKGKISGPPDREVRFNLAARASRKVNSEIECHQMEEPDVQFW